ncbi:MAG: TetR/AcrR family transcriptional regulator [Sneathiellales bacterium]|nr:TetR/AcrR family transcriptional regulator [Sneathiellales bacterium]
MQKLKGRPRKFDAEAVLDAAEIAFLKNGYSGVSVDDICRKAKINKSTLYNSFGDKKQLYLEVLERFRQMMHRQISERIASHATFSEAIRAIFEAFATVYFDRFDQPSGCLMTGTASVEVLRDEEIAKRASAILNEMDLGFLHIIRKARKAGELKEGLPDETLSRMISTSLHSLGIRARCGEKRSIAQEMAKELIFVLGKEQKGCS